MTAEIQKIDIYGIGPDGERISWSSYLGPMYEALIIVKLSFSDGIEGIAGLTTYTEHDFDRSAFHAAALMAPFLLGQKWTDIPAIYQAMRQKYVPLGHLATSLFDIALHDAKGKSLNLPIYQMLGAARHKIRSYASSPLLTCDQDYISYCHDMLGQGFTAIKIHPYCVFEDDYRLVQAILEAFQGQQIGWSLDCDGMYSYEQALKMGRLLDQAGWEFFEAPLPDTQLRNYARLAAALDLDVICGGNTLPDLALIDLALSMDAWDRSRFDVTSIGGFSGAAQVIAATKAQGRRSEIQSWGYSLTQAANLHMMLATDNCDYLEQAAPYEKYEIGSCQVFRPDMEGFVHPASLPGLGVELDWSVLSPYIYAHQTIEG